MTGEAYPTAVGSETRSNYLRAGLIMNTTYSDNVLGEYEATPVSDTSYSIWPTIAIDKVTSRMRWDSIYSPGITIYEHTSALNETDQNAMLNVSFRVSPHMTASLRESFRKTSDVLNQPDSFSGGAISGSGGPAFPLIAVTADQLTNTANGELTYQFDRNSMVGGGGTFTILHYPHPTQAAGLYNSSSQLGSAFYSHRLSGKQYVGGIYQYSETLSSASDTQSDAQTNAILFFYTAYLKPTLSFSVSAGPQSVDITQHPSPTYHTWSPAVIASMGWQERRVSLAASYGRLITGGGGLVGAYYSENAAASIRWQFAHTWNLGSAASYMLTNNVSPSTRLAAPGGHSISGSASVQHSISEHLMVELGYARLLQRYSNIAVIATAPNTDRAFFVISYQFARALGR